MATSTSPCRLFVILARNAPVGAIFRRGPSKWVQIIKWNTDTDTFEPGQWFHGRIFEKRGDLSPDGRKLIYYASKSLTGWTAISKLPYLTAIKIWHVPFRTYYGGGLFLADASIEIDSFGGSIYVDSNGNEINPFRTTFRKPILDRNLSPLSHPHNGVVYDVRLARDGWITRQVWNPEFRSSRGYTIDQPTLREKPHPQKPWMLVMTSSLVDFLYLETYFVYHQANESVSPITSATWADWDQQGRLVFARDGKLFKGYFSEAGEIIEMEIADFNLAKPEPVEAPEWAKVW